MQPVENIQELNSIKDIEKFVNDILYLHATGKVAKNQIDSIVALLGKDFLDNTIQGHGYTKPFGYAGDFKIIDDIYTCKRSNNPVYKAWDEFFHQQSAPIAVRNRKTYFKEKASKALKEGGNLLNIASGPARDLLELLQEHNLPKVKFTCVDMDENAISYAKRLNANYLEQINFIKTNVFRFNTSQKFDMIWSAGFFDYFDDDAFVFLLKRCKKWLKPKGEMIIGNFNESWNPSRPYMEIFSDWYLHHRTATKLFALGKKAGFNAHKIYIGREPENVNLFLHLIN